MVRTKDEVNAYNREWYANRKAEHGGENPYKETRQEYYASNKEAFAERSKDWYSDKKNTDFRLLKQWKISKKELRSKQNNKCSIGGEELSPLDSETQIDHDHSCCGKGRSCGYCVRGLACRPHNVGLGMFGDDCEQLERAVQYLIDNKIRLFNLKMIERNEETNG